MTKEKLASMIDQTLLSATASEEDVKAFCENAKKYKFASVCINPVYVKLAAKILKGSKTKVCTVIDFPLGSGGINIKTKSASCAIKDGAEEVDVVIDIAKVKMHDWTNLENEMKKFTASVQKDSGKRKSSSKRVLTKVILETCYLTNEEISEASKCAKRAGFDFVKTSTGFAILKGRDGMLLPNGATINAVKTMRDAVGKKMGVKASGGIHSTKEALSLIEAGATRIGASSGVQIVDGFAE